MHPEILSEAQQKLLPFVADFKNTFYLVGGTAIALQIGHRRSIDFDLFKKSTIQREKIAQRFTQYEIPFQVLFADAEGFHVTAQGVKLTFFQFPFLIPAKQSFQGIPMPDLLHLASMKAYSLGRRAKWKDYVDLYFIFRDHFSLDEVMYKTDELFAPLFSPKLFRQQLCYFNDIDYTEEVEYMPGLEVPESLVKDALTRIALSEL